MSVISRAEFVTSSLGAGRAVVPIGTMRSRSDGSELLSIWIDQRKRPNMWRDWDEPIVPTLERIAHRKRNAVLSPRTLVGTPSSVAGPREGKIE